MKLLKVFILCLIGLIGAIFRINAQNNAGITTIGSYSACAGTRITLPLTISGSPDLAVISLEIDYDGTVLSYIKTNGLSNADANLSSTSSFQSNQTTISGTNKKLLIAWISGDGFAWTVNPGGTPGTGKLCDISFRYLGGTTTLSFNNSINLSFIL